MTSKNAVTAWWAWDAGYIWATTSDGRRLRAWPADASFAFWAGVLNTVPTWSADMLAMWEALQQE